MQDYSQLERFGVHYCHPTPSWSNPLSIERVRQEVASWYRDVPINILLSYLHMAKLAPGVVKGISLLGSAGIKTAIVSITWEFAVQWFSTRFGVDYYLGTKLTNLGEIVHFWPDDKPTWLTNLARSLGITLDQVAAVGDSGGDVAMFQAVGFPYFVGESLPAEILHAVHMPDADIALLAEQIVGQANDSEPS